MKHPLLTTRFAYRSVRLFGAPVVALVFWSQPNGYSDVILNGGGTTKLEVVARDTSVSFLNTITDLTPTAVPYANSADASVGASFSHADFSLTSTGFTFSTSGARNGLIDSRANIQPTIFFSVTQDSSYALSGSLTVDDPNNTGRYEELSAVLKDLTTSGTLYSSAQSSQGVVDASFVLGGSAGNVDNSNSGSATGLLLAGHEYRLDYGSSIYANNSGDSATFDGSFTITFSPANSVPDGGSTALLLTISSFGLVALKRGLRTANS